MFFQIIPYPLQIHKLQQRRHQRAKPLVYLHGEYFRLGEMIVHFGCSVRKKKTIRREKAAR